MVLDYVYAAYASAVGAAGMTETVRLSLRPTLKQTVPSTNAISVWSEPMWMFSPGWNSVPR